MQHLGRRAPDTVAEVRTVEAAPPAPLWKLVLFALVPLVLLGAALLAVAQMGLPGTSSVPVEELSFTRVVVTDDGFELRALVTGVEDVEVAQVLVNDLIVDFTVDPEGPVERLDAFTVHVPFRWVETEPYAIDVVTATGLKFGAEVAAAYPAPKADARAFGTLALLGVYVGVVPVLAGLLWRPLLERAGDRAVRFVLGVTVGLLLFLAADTLLDGFEAAELIPAALHPEVLLVAGALGAFALLLGVGQHLRGRGDSAMVVAGLVAVGIGLHNLAEGLAIGGAFALGEVALGLTLVVGFALHNTTEGLAIVSPLARHKVKIAALVGLGLVAGLPTILGAWLGGLVADPWIALVFLAIGVGAIAAVVVEIDRGWRGQLRRGAGLLGAVVGFAIMYVTSLVVTA